MVFLVLLLHYGDFILSFHPSDNPMLSIEMNIVFLYEANFISKSEWRRRRDDVDIRIAINILRIFDQLNYIGSSEYRSDVMRDIAACLLSSLSPMSNDSAYNVPLLQSHINKFYFFF